MENGVMKRIRWAAPGRLIPWRRDRQVAIVGLARAGKTSFLTSLINHLKYHSPERFSFGRGDLYVSHFQEDEPSKPDGWPKFPYTAHRQGLIEQGRWPVKTKDHSAFQCRFRLGRGRVQLALYDVPGERMADAKMAESSYEHWSDHVLAAMQSSDGRTSTLTPEFTRMLADQAEDSEAFEHSAVAKYKSLVAGRAKRFSWYVSPSTLLLDQEGRVAKTAREIERMPSGLQGGEFIPLPKAVRERTPDLCRWFAERYEKYRKRMVQPLFDTLRSCDSMVLVVDVLDLLRGGVDRFNDSVHMVHDVIASLTPKTNARWSRAPRIRRVAVAGSQFDRAGESQRARMTSLVREMAAQEVEGRFRRTLYTSIASIVSARECAATEQGRGTVRLVGTLEDNGGDSRASYEASRLPEEWPRGWGPKEHQFARVLPDVPPRINLPPEQVGVDEVLRFVLSLKER